MKNWKGAAAAAITLSIVLLGGCRFQDSIVAYLNLSPSAVSSAGSASPKPTATPMATPVATPTPTATPVPTPSPAPTTSEDYPVVERYTNTVPQDLTMALQYDRYETPLNYIAALKGGTLFAKPDGKSQKLTFAGFGRRLESSAMVTGADGKNWYHVYWTDKKGSHDGYLRESAGSARGFRLAMMLERAKTLKQTADEADTVHIVNYKNFKGMAPLLPGGTDADASGNRRSQSAPAYAEASTKSAFRYAPDGLLGKRLEQANGMTKIYFPTFGEERWVPDKYVSKQADSITSLTQVIVVDRKYQNSAVFSYENGGWKLLSMSYVSTGKSGGYSLKTPLGDFVAQDRLSKFFYYKDGTKVIDGYAPYAIRFSGGGYLHGVPRKLGWNADGTRKDPGISESLSTLGTTPQSHMCVRNYTSQAKFLYDWYKAGQCSVIVVE